MSEHADGERPWASQCGSPRADRLGDASLDALRTGHRSPALGVGLVRNVGRNRRAHAASRCRRHVVRAVVVVSDPHMHVLERSNLVEQLGRSADLCSAAFRRKSTASAEGPDRIGGWHRNGLGETRLQIKTRSRHSPSACSKEMEITLYHSRSSFSRSRSASRSAKLFFFFSMITSGRRTS